MHDNTIAVILGGGRGARIAPLTTLRSKPAVPIGGQYRLIDIPISNCLHADIRNIYVLTQFNSASLHRHIQQTYNFDNFSPGGVELLAAEQTQDNLDWYQGTADAVRKHLRRLPDSKDDLVLILSGDQLYRMDFKKVIADHLKHDAEITLAVQAVTGADAHRFGIVKTDQDGQIRMFHEKPKENQDLDPLRIHADTSNESENRYLASMGIYIFRADILHEVLHSNDFEDFGKNILPAAIENRRVYTYEHQGYWEDIGTIRSFYEANLALTDTLPAFDLYSSPPIYTHPRFLPGAKLDRCQLNRAIIGAGSILVETEIEHAVVGIRSRIGPSVIIRNSVLMGADYYETAPDILLNSEKGIPNIGIGQGSIIESAIIDKNARIGENVRIQNTDGVPQLEAENYIIQDGIVVVPKDAIIPSGTII